MTPRFYTSSDEKYYDNFVKKSFWLVDLPEIASKLNDEVLNLQTRISLDEAHKKEIVKENTQLRKVFETTNFASLVEMYLKQNKTIHFNSKTALYDFTKWLNEYFSQ